MSLTVLRRLRSAGVDGRSFPRQLMCEIRREAKLLSVVMDMRREIEAEIAGMTRDENKRRHSRQRGQKHPIALRLAQIRGVGRQTAGILATEVFYRKFRNRREVASYVGLTPTPHNSGASVRDQGISKAGNRRARTIAIELAWIWLRKLVVALWQFVENGMDPEGATATV